MRIKLEENFEEKFSFVRYLIQPCSVQISQEFYIEFACEVFQKTQKLSLSNLERQYFIVFTFICTRNQSFSSSQLHQILQKEVEDYIDNNFIQQSFSPLELELYKRTLISTNDIRLDYVFPKILDEIPITLKELIEMQPKSILIEEDCRIIISKILSQYFLKISQQNIEYKISNLNEFFESVIIYKQSDLSLWLIQQRSPTKKLVTLTSQIINLIIKMLYKSYTSDNSYAFVYQSPKDQQIIFFTSQYKLGRISANLMNFIVTMLNLEDNIKIIIKYGSDEILCQQIINLPWLKQQTFGCSQMHQLGQIQQHIQFSTYNIETKMSNSSFSKCQTLQNNEQQINICNLNNKQYQVNESKEIQNIRQIQHLERRGSPLIHEKCNQYKESNFYNQNASQICQFDNKIHQSPQRQLYQQQQYFNFLKQVQNDSYQQTQDQYYLKIKSNNLKNQLKCEGFIDVANQEHKTNQISQLISYENQDCINQSPINSSLDSSKDLLQSKEQQEQYSNIIQLKLNQDKYSLYSIKEEEELGCLQSELFEIQKIKKVNFQQSKEFADKSSVQFQTNKQVIQSFPSYIKNIQDDKFLQEEQNSEDEDNSEMIPSELDSNIAIIKKIRAEQYQAPPFIPFCSKTEYIKSSNKIQLDEEDFSINEVLVMYRNQSKHHSDTQVKKVKPVIFSN